MSVERNLLAEWFYWANEAVSRMLNVAPAEIEWVSNPTTPMQAIAPHGAKRQGVIQIDVDAAFWSPVSATDVAAVTLLVIAHEYFHLLSALHLKRFERLADRLSGLLLRRAGFVPVDVAGFVSSFTASQSHGTAAQRYGEVVFGWNCAEKQIRLSGEKRQRREAAQGILGILAVFGVVCIAAKTFGD